jgi:branched-chain amino acid transport system ATP-binding protein
MTDGTPMLGIDGLCSGYNGPNVISDVALEIAAGETVAILGPNGAGKTTLLRTVAGLLRTRAGTITFSGHDVTRDPAYARARRGIGLVPENRGVFGRLTVSENLRISQRKRSRVTIDDVLDMFPVLRQRAAQQAGTLSGGERQMLGLARTLLREPSLLLLDEPSLGLAPTIVDQVFEHIAQIAANRRTTVIVEQNATKAIAVADRVHLLSRGSIVWSGSAEEARSQDLAEQYLGGL